MMLCFTRTVFILVADHLFFSTSWLSFANNSGSFFLFLQFLPFIIKVFVGPVEEENTNEELEIFSKKTAQVELDG